MYPAFRLSLHNTPWSSDQQVCVLNIYSLGVPTNQWAPLEDPRGGVTRFPCLRFETPKNLNRNLANHMNPFPVQLFPSDWHAKCSRVSLYWKLFSRCGIFDVSPLPLKKEQPPQCKLRTSKPTKNVLYNVWCHVNTILLALGYELTYWPHNSC